MKNYTKAAKALYITQPTLTQQIKQIENELGYELFIRSHRSIELTAAGQVFYKHANLMLKQWDDCIHDLTESNSGVNGSMRLGMFWTIGHLGYFDMLNEFNKIYPNAKVTLKLDGATRLIDDLMNNQLDATFITHALCPQSSINHRVLDQFEYFVCEQSVLCAVMSPYHPLAVKETLHFKDLQGQKILSMSRHSQMYPVFEELIKTNHVECDIIGYSSQADAIIQVAAANLGIGFLCQDTINGINNPNVISIPLQPMINRQIIYATNPNHQNPLERLFYRHLVSLFKHTSF